MRPVVNNGLVEDRAALGQTLERPDLVSAHEAGIAFHVGCQNCR
jgi:hypothetical protein